MLTLLRVIPAWAYILLSAILLLGVQQYRINSIQASRAELKSSYDRHLLADSIASANAYKEALRRQVAADKAEEQANVELSAANDAAISAVSDADSLRKQVARLLASRGATCATIAAATGKATRSASGLLAELFDESVHRNTILAAALDRSRIAGLTCERIYNESRH